MSGGAMISQSLTGGIAMSGPMDKMFGHTAFDFNHDGNINAAEWAFIEETIFADDMEENKEEGVFEDNESESDIDDY